MKASLLVAVALGLAGCNQTQTSVPADAATSGCAASPGGSLIVRNAWIRAQAEPTGMSAAYFELCNASLETVTITALTTPAAGIVELHETTRDARGIVSMSPTGPVTLAAGEAMTFEPGGRHAMLMSLSAPIAEGSAAELTFNLADGNRITVEAKALSTADAVAHAH